MNLNDPALFWLIGAIALVIIELLVASEFLLYLGAACVGGMIASWLGYGLSGQLFGYAIAATVMLLFFRPVFNRLFYRKDAESTNIDALIGRKGIVTEEVDNQGGRVLVGGESWRAVSEIPHAEGMPVMITAVRGATLLVDHYPQENGSEL